MIKLTFSQLKAHELKNVIWNFFHVNLHIIVSTNLIDFASPSNYHSCFTDYASINFLLHQLLAQRGKHQKLISEMMSPGRRENEATVNQSYRKNPWHSLLLLLAPISNTSIWLSSCRRRCRLTTFC
jgi:hypothetical protein